MRRRSDGPDETPSRAVELSWRSRARPSRSWSEGGRRLAACSLRSALRTLTRTTRPRCRKVTHWKWVNTMAYSRYLQGPDFYIHKASRAEGARGVDDGLSSGLRYSRGERPQNLLNALPKAFSVSWPSDEEIA